MRRLLALAIPAVVLLGAPSVAPAKGIMGATVCGADGCREIPSPDHRLLEGGAAADAPARPEPFVRMSIRVGVPDHVESIRLVFLPHSGLVLGNDGGTWMRALELGALRAAARGVEPFAASKLAGAASNLAATVDASGKPLPPEVVVAEPPPAAATASDDGFDGWWLALGAGAIVLAAGLVLTRRRRREPPPAAARAAG